MSNAPQTQNQPAKNAPSSSQSNTNKVGNNVRKDEPTAKKSTGTMKDGSCCAPGDKSAKA